uniref:hypothetical protein n=1 Tax=Prevotella sp. TaxID=59823 RepID=UPI0025E3AE81
MQQPAAKFNTEFSQQVADQLKRDIFSISWGHHMLLIDKFLTEPQTIEEWEAKLGGNIEHE